MAASYGAVLFLWYAYYGVLFSTIYLGQHYITDLVAGVVVAASCVIIVTRMDRKGKTSRLVSPTGKL
jgi:membrane-associated phospholipid phosphatase